MAPGQLGSTVMADYRLPVEGGCLCGAVRFVADRAPLQGAFCHCKACRRSYGGLFQAAVQFAADGFGFTRGEPRYYRSSPSARRGFCETCGCPLVFRYDGIADLWVLIGALDRPELWPLTRGATWGPVAHYHADRRVPWHILDDGLPQWTSDRTPFLDKAERHAVMPRRPRK